MMRMIMYSLRYLKLAHRERSIYFQRYLGWRGIECANVRTNTRRDKINTSLQNGHSSSAHSLVRCTTRLVPFHYERKAVAEWMRCARNRCQPVRESFALPISALTLLAARQVDRPVHRWSFCTRDGVSRNTVQFQGNWKYVSFASLDPLTPH